MSDSAYPEVTSGDQLKVAPSRDYVCCMGCTDGPRLDEATDPVEWARKHRALKPWHDRFRVERYTNFSVAPGQPDVICGATRKLSMQLFDESSGDVDLDQPDVTVTCNEAPHPGNEHSGPLVVNGARLGVHVWTAGAPDPAR
ncbi:hypothetical protein ACH4OQ_35950 [Streptomyces luteogriseus]|uniref:hypothetical protein n=1 Tax=Streptomyces luteogriseus TaxID=68233 RepID=UPI0037AAB354